MTQTITIQSHNLHGRCCGVVFKGTPQTPQPIPSSPLCTYHRQNFRPAGSHFRHSTHRPSPSKMYRPPLSTFPCPPSSVVSQSTDSSTPLKNCKGIAWKFPVGRYPINPKAHSINPVHTYNRQHFRPAGSHFRHPMLLPYQMPQPFYLASCFLAPFPPSFFHAHASYFFLCPSYLFSFLHTFFLPISFLRSSYFCASFLPFFLRHTFLPSFLLTSSLSLLSLSLVPPSFPPSPHPPFTFLLLSHPPKPHPQEFLHSTIPKFVPFLPSLPQVCALKGTRSKVAMQGPRRPILGRACGATEGLAALAVGAGPTKGDFLALAGKIGSAPTVRLTPFS